jgi:hypothetical protein
MRNASVRKASNFTIDTGYPVNFSK